MPYPILAPVLALFIAWSASSLAQTCNTAITADAPSSRYIAYSNGTVRDKQTGLVWKRCSEGQTWQAGGCTGDAAGFGWQQALAADTASFAGASDWRLPNLKELQSLVEHRCTAPAINLAVFPNTQVYYYWSSSPFSSYGNSAWIVGFDKGDDNWGGKGNPSFYVRLVRSGQ